MTSGAAAKLPTMSHVEPLEDIFAPFALRISCGPLRMRFVRDVDVPEIAAAIHEHGIYSPDQPMPFMRRWAEAGHDLAVNTLQYYYDAFASWSPESWILLLHVSMDGRFVGIQHLEAIQDFRQTRAAETGSWLLRHEQGKGIGTLMRQAVLAFAFDELGAQVLESGGMVGNQASLAVSRKLGYVPNGYRRYVHADGVGWRDVEMYRLAPGDLVRAPYPVKVTGAAAFRASIGLPDAR
ncbi:MAG: N-acetyltransferase [Kocuria rhizophila]|nr:MAG: N-acetyltransferase [Kocuria rhizophila]